MSEKRFPGPAKKLSLQLFSNPNVVYLPPAPPYLDRPRSRRYEKYKANHSHQRSVSIMEHLADKMTSATPQQAIMREALYKAAENDERFLLIELFPLINSHNYSTKKTPCTKMSTISLLASSFKPGSTISFWNFINNDKFRALRAPEVAEQIIREIRVKRALSENANPLDRYDPLRIPTRLRKQ